MGPRDKREDDTWGRGGRRFFHVPVSRSPLRLTRIHIIWPQHIEGEGVGLERRGGYGIGVLERRGNQPLAIRQSEHFERLGKWINIPAVPDAERGINGEFICAVELLRGWRQHFAHPVGRRFDERRFRELG